jgi:hypothetical protein
MTSTSSDWRQPSPLRLGAAVGLVAAAMLTLEIVVTRLFSVLFYYHFSFFAISLVMSGLVAGGLVAARWNAPELPQEAFENRLAWLALIFAVGTAAALAFMVHGRFDDPSAPPSLYAAALDALVFLPGLVAAGAHLALAFARSSARIGSLYAFDLAGAALACVFSVPALRALAGPGVLLVPVVLAAFAALLLARARLARDAAIAMIAGGVVLCAADAETAGSLLHLRVMPGGPTVRALRERWNEHSRVLVYDAPSVGGRYLVIDRSAGTLMEPLPLQPDGSPPVVPAELASGPQYQVYGLGRPLRSVAVIGVGGGSDLLPPLYNGAKRVDGYELNQLLIDLLQRDFSTYNALTSRPEVHLFHTEARVGITHSDQRYDVIQASLIDTWAATASGGFVLSENGLYTVEGWRTFLGHLTDTGVLTMTRWHIESAPAETHRLVSLAAAALSDSGIPDAGAHLVLMESASNDKQPSEGHATSTVLVSKKAFTADEVARLDYVGLLTSTRVVAAPGRSPADPTIGRLLRASERTGAIRESPYDIAAPTDSKPYFFLQVRPSDLFHLAMRRYGVVTEITFNGVRVMMILAICSLLFVAAIGAYIALRFAGTPVSPRQRSAHRWMTLYFACIGFGYVLVQLGLHQRLIVVFGHPTLALSIVLFCMLVGTSAGAASSAPLISRGRFAMVGAIILPAIALCVAAQPLVPYLERVESQPARMAMVGVAVTALGFALGLAFPTGVRHLETSDGRAIQKMWAVNGAASIAGSALAALIGLSLGSTAVLGAGLLAYAAATASGMFAARAAG